MYFIQTYQKAPDSSPDFPYETDFSRRSTSERLRKFDERLFPSLSQVGGTIEADTIGSRQLSQIRLKAVRQTLHQFRELFQTDLISDLRL
jgi:hypothetical protein